MTATARGRVLAVALASVLGTGAALGVTACGEDRGNVEVEGSTTGGSTTGGSTTGGSTTGGSTTGGSTTGGSTTGGSTTGTETGG